MLYFKKIYLLNNSEKQELEKSLRSKSLKRSQMLDFVFETSNIGTDKYFLGNEGKKDLKLTRIKTSFESFLPKIIISFPKETAIQYYKFRLSVLSTLILALLSFLLLISFLDVVMNQKNAEAFLITLVLSVIYFSFILLELKITKNRILKSINLDKRV
ncbi:hypothetical protein [Pedobacter miscanthi]|uniref:Uncharacterized protein n=1 Tax=Pedobacter miscanthi TaxID=2259170 RepID=A0A366KSK8_9SPHI|nr:hypothetical protein [Pedobacter miscanthi]RBQ04625.1 hypothetical protein DRW42_18540 [Pedobacter miscanthi]